VTLVLTHLFFFHFGERNLDKAEALATRAMEVAEESQGEFEIFVETLSRGCSPP
jgi:hypothetical protein